MSKKLITTNITTTAKMPIRKMTLDHIQQAYNEQFTAVGRSIGTDDSGATVAKDILYGLTYTITGSAFVGTAGAVYTQGEIFQVDASSFTIGAGEYPIFVLATTYATGDPTEFTDGNTYQIHQIRKLSVVSGTTSTANYYGTLSEFSNKNTPVTITTGSGITNGANITSSTIRAKKDRLGLIVMSGFAQMNSSFAVGQIICTLASTHRPAHDTRVVTTIVNGSTNNSCIVTVDDTTGEVRLQSDPNTLVGNNAVIWLDNIVFYAI